MEPGTKAVIYLAPCTDVQSIREMVLAAEGSMGLMLTPQGGRRRNLIDLYPVWAADTGCYAARERFSLERYLAWLESMLSVSDRCLFATAPDVVGDAAATWERSRDVLPILRRMGYRAALVAQDGISGPDWDAFDSLFIGGTTDYKLSPAARCLGQEARRRGKWLHMGRVNTRRRITIARTWGCDSVDGTAIALLPDKLSRCIRRWLGEANHQGMLQL